VQAAAISGADSTAVPEPMHLCNNIHPRSVSHAFDRCRTIGADTVACQKCTWFTRLPDVDTQHADNLTRSRARGILEGQAATMKPGAAGKFSSLCCFTLPLPSVTTSHPHTPQAQSPPTCLPSKQTTASVNSGGSLGIPQLAKQAHHHQQTTQPAPTHQHGSGSTTSCPAPVGIACW
jgi:hypothetical protein